MRFEYVISEGLRIEDMERTMRDMLGIMCRSYGEGKPMDESDVYMAMDRLKDLGVIP